jgi:carbon-monoxide dehydrogenase medium subunit
VLHHVAHPAIRSRGTVVGSIAHADPAAELPALLVLLEGEARVRGAGESRTVPATDLFAGHLETTLRPGEWIEEVRLPVQKGGGAFEEFARRQGDYALCGVAALATGGRVALSYVGMGPVPLRLEVDEVGEAVAQLEPEDDIHASAAYRRWLAERLGARAARRAREAA